MESSRGATIADDLNKQSSDGTRPRRKRRRKRVMGIGQRLVLLVAGGIFGLVVCFGVVTKIFQPYEMQHQQGAQIRQLKSELAVDTASNTDLQRQIDYLQRPDGIETAARAQGFLKPGEVSLAINAKMPANAGGQASPGFSGMIKRAWHNLTSR